MVRMLKWCDPPPSPSIGYIIVDGMDLASISELTVTELYVTLAASYLIDSLIYWYDFEKETKKDEPFRRWAQTSEITNVVGSALYFGNTTNLKLHHHIIITDDHILLL
jgi:hypothetical protein